MKKSVVHDKRIDLSEIRKSIVQGDAIDSVAFLVPRIYNGVDLSLYDIYLKYENDVGKGESLLLKKENVSDTSMTLIWEIKGGFSQDHGQHKIQLWCAEIKAGETVMKWQTYPAQIEVIRTISPTPLVLDTPAVLEQYLAIFQQEILHFDVQSNRIGLRKGPTGDFTYTDDLTGPQGPRGEQGEQGIQGPKGDDGKVATVSVGAVTTLPAGSNATVTNAGTAQEAVFNFGIPRGEDCLVAGNAGSHNAIYRGENLGTSVTAEQYAAISAGTFDDLYIGDYWTIDGVNYRIAAFDYYLNCGNTSCTKHHVVIVPDTCLYNAQMHNTSSGQHEPGAANTTAGGYVGSDMYKTNLEQAKTIINAAFPNHVLKHRVYLTNAVTNGRPSANAWCDSEVDLMCEQMVYGGPIFMPMSNGSTPFTNYRVEKSQLPLFAHEPSRITNRKDWWLRDVVTASFFAFVNNSGNAYCYNASSSIGVRPAFCIF